MAVVANLKEKFNVKDILQIPAIMPLLAMLRMQQLLAFRKFCLYTFWNSTKCEIEFAYLREVCFRP